MDGAVIAFACVVVGAAILVLVVVIAYLIRDRHELEAAHRADRQELVRAVIARHSGEVIQMQRSEQAPYLAQLEAETLAGLHPANDGLWDPETHERIVPVGFDS